jgi:dipeptidyl aminopeptidase/acylaminoacyl peptidase
MAGNVREWASNLVPQPGARYLLGGAYGDALYAFTQPDSEAPLARGPKSGFRCVKYAAPPDEVLLQPVNSLLFDYSRARPVSTAAFQAYRSLYAYDRGPLEATVDGTSDSSRHYRDETVSFRAAYGGERMTAHLLLPRNAQPPFQIVVFYPGDGAFRTPWRHPFTTFYVEFLLRSGRAVLYPFYKGMHERKAAAPEGALEYRDRVIQWSKDLGRSIDYAETRSDLDSQRLAFYGFSRGAMLGPILTAVEPRLKASVLLCGGLGPRPPPAEIDPINFAPLAARGDLRAEPRPRDSEPVRAPEGR